MSLRRSGPPQMFISQTEPCLHRDLRHMRICTHTHAWAHTPTLQHSEKKNKGKAGRAHKQERGDAQKKQADQENFTYEIRREIGSQSVSHLRLPLPAPVGSEILQIQKVLSNTIIVITYLQFNCQCQSSQFHRNQSQTLEIRVRLTYWNISLINH